MKDPRDGAARPSRSRQVEKESGQMALAFDAAETGMTSAADHADREVGDWRGKAAAALRAYIVEARRQNILTFMAEDARGWAEKRGLPTPPDKRAWGAVISKASRAGFIEKAGYAPAVSSNSSPKCLWRLL